MASSEHGIPLSIVNIAFTPEYITAVIDRVLQCGDKASGGVRKGLQAAINNSIKLDGFRNSSKAPTSRLRDPMLWQVTHGDDRLIGEVLRTWVETRKDLQDSVKNYLTDAGFVVEGPDLREGVFYSAWLTEQWQDTIERVCRSNPEFDRDDVRMMVCYLSGMVEKLAVGSEPLAECIAHLRSLPVDAPDWHEFDDFIAIVGEIADSNAGRRTAFFAERCRDTLQQIQREFADELQYLEIDVAAWQEAGDRRPYFSEIALKMADHLQEMLAEYQEIRPQAPSRQVEEERRPARERREEAILAVVADWERMIAAADDLSGGENSGADAATSAADGAPADGEPSAAPAPSDAGPPEEIQALRAERERLVQERASLKSENDRLQSENERLAKANTGLEADKQALHSEHSELKARLSPSRDLEEYWRRFYGTSPFEQVRNVNDAVLRVQEIFPEQIVIALNSRSEKDCQFQRPVEALAALAWLATDYHHLRWTKSGEDPRFDERLKKSCPGWSYKPHQANTIKQQFAEWYTTKVAGRRYELGEHLGKGTSADPQKTIRIAFAWDDERGQVIVGYIGRHQKNRRS